MKEKINWKNASILVLMGVIGFVLGVIMAFNSAIKYLLD